MFPGGLPGYHMPGGGIPPSRLSGRFVLLAGLVFLLVLGGLGGLQNGLLALALPLVIYLAATLLYWAPAPSLRVERAVGAVVARPGATVPVSVVITNQGPALDEVYLEDTLPQGLELVDGKTRLLTSLPEQAQVELRYTVRARRGSFIFDEVEAAVRDHLGISRQKITLSAQRKLVFMPQVVRLRRVAIRPPRTLGHFGPIPSRKTGSGVDFIGLREYQLGDPRRWINWRASMRHNQQLFVNQFEQERMAEVGIILDARAQSNVVLASGESLFEYAVQAAGSLSEALLNDGNRVGMLIYGFGMERVFPGYGKVQQERILYALGHARIGRNFALESMGQLPTRFFPTGSQIVMISPLLAPDIAAFMQLRAGGYEVMLISPDPVEFEARALGVLDDLPYQIARVERALLLRKLQRMGVRILDWKVNHPLEPLVRAQLGRVNPGVRLSGVLR